MKNNASFAICLLSIVVWIFFFLNILIQKVDPGAAALEQQLDLTQLHTQIDELLVQSLESKKLLLNFTDMYEEFNELSALMKTMQSEREDLSMGNGGDKRKIQELEAKIVSLQKARKQKGNNLKQKMQDVDQLVDNIVEDFFVFIEDFTCEHFGYESIFTVKLCEEAARRHDIDGLDTEFSIDTNHIDLPQGCSKTDNGLFLNVAGGGKCNQSGYHGCFCHKSRWDPALQYRGFNHYLHYKDGEATIMFFHNVPQSKGFSFVNIQPVAKVRQRPVLFEPVLDKRLCLLLRQSARWDLWSAGPETMPYPCPMNQDTFSIVEEKKLHLFSSQYELTKDPDIRLAYAQDALVNMNGNVYVKSSNEVLILDDCAWYPDQIRISSLKHVSYDTYSLQYTQNDLPSYDDVFLSTQAWGSTTYHWMMEEMPRIIPWVQFLKENPEVKIHQTGRDKTIIKNFLDLVGIDISRLIDGKIHAKRLWTYRGTSCGLSQVYPSQLMNQYFRNIIDSPLVTDESSIPILFIIRQGHRQVKEEIRTRALQWFLEDSPLNFDVMIYNESQSFRELATMSRRANIIFGGHGAGLSNILWSEPGTLLIELHLFDGDLRYPNLCYYWSAMTMGMKYLGISYTDTDESAVDWMFEFLIKEYSNKA